MVHLRPLILRAIGRSSLLMRAARGFARTPFRFIDGKPLNAWLLQYRLGRRWLTLCNDPAIVERVLHDRTRQFPKSQVLHELLRPMIGNGLFGQTQGATIRIKRQLYSRALARIPDGQIAEITRALTSAYATRWTSEYRQRPLPLCTELSRLTTDIVSRATLGSQFSAEESRRFSELFFEYHRRALPLVLMADDRPDASQQLIARMELHPIAFEMRNLIRRRFIDPLADRASAPLSAPFAKELREAGYLNHGSETEQALDEIAVMLLAGHETTASVLSWLIWELAHRPDYQDRIAGPAAEGPSVSDDWLKAMIKEALRLYPPIAFFLRESSSETEIRGKPVKAGSLFAVAPWTLHRHRRLWTQPDEFQPERWLATTPACPRSVFIPFGLGPRACPGAHFAAIETQQLLGTLLRTFRFHATSDSRPQPLGSLTSRPDREIKLLIEPRRQDPTPP